MFFTERCPSGGTKYVSFEFFLGILSGSGEGRGGAPGTVPLQNPEGSLFLPEAVATDVQRQAEAMDASLITPPLPDEEEHSTHSPEEREHFPSLGVTSRKACLRNADKNARFDTHVSVLRTEVFAHLFLPRSRL